MHMILINQKYINLNKLILNIVNSNIKNVFFIIFIFIYIKR